MSKREIYFKNKEDKQSILLKDNDNSSDNYIFDNNKTMEKNDDENDFPNIDYPHKEANIIQTFNPNNFNDKNKESSFIIKDINKNENNKEEQEIMKRINFFEENSFLNYNK